MDDPRYRAYFIVISGNPDLSKVVRPRALPLLTTFETPSGAKQVWTTFSADQIDLNYSNPEVLLEIIDIILFYASRGADLIRLDAIAYLWKEIGTPCIHLPQTHAIVKLLRAVLDQAAPHVMLITETNVPHPENISYFGNGHDEAQLVYNFPLPPLVLYTLHTGDASVLSAWARGLQLPSRQATFFNFLASHDGIGINPARGILSPGEIDLLVEKTLEHGGAISYKHLPDGSQLPYELNINYFDALCNPHEPIPLEEQVGRFMAAQAIMLSLTGIPGIYFHSLFGSLGWPEGMRATRQARTINRQKLRVDDLERELSEPGSRRARVYKRFQQLLQARLSCPAFDPFGEQRVIDCGTPIFALERTHPDLDRRVLCLQNVSGYPQTAHIPQADSKYAIRESIQLRDLVSGRIFSFDSRSSIHLKPYETVWLENYPPA
jgi:sucrose phosphorylase